MNVPGPTAYLVQLYKAYLADQDTAAFIKAVSARYTKSTLDRLVSMASREGRRAAVLALGLVGDFSSNPVVGRALNDSDKGVRTLAENTIRALWHQGGDEEQNQQLTAITRMNLCGQYQQAVAAASALIEQAPWYAEIWNQRAIAFYRLEKYEDAIYDCHQTLELNPFHFGAASGMGQCYLLEEDFPAALQCFRRALKLNPNLDEVRATVTFLERSLETGRQPGGDDWKSAGDDH